MLSSILGLVAAAGFVLAAVPIVYRVYKTPRLEGWSLTGYLGLFVAVWALQVQLALLHSWVFFAAQGINTLAVTYCLWAVWKKAG